MCEILGLGCAANLACALGEDQRARMWGGVGKGEGMSYFLSCRVCFAFFLLFRLLCIRVLCISVCFFTVHTDPAHSIPLCPTPPPISPTQSTTPSPSPSLPMPKHR